MNIFKDRFETCYWCGLTAVSREHVPPQNLFPKGFRQDLIRVGACKTHNEEFSKLDERMRYHMTLMGDDVIARKHYETKTYNGLKRPQGIGLTFSLASGKLVDEDGNNMQSEETGTFELYFEKIVRGLFYYHFGKIVNGSVSYFSNKIKLVNLSMEAHFYFHRIDEKFKSFWINSDQKNKDVFDYKYYYSKNEDRFFVIMTFYKVHEVIGVTLPAGKSIDDYGLSYDEYFDEQE